MGDGQPWYESAFGRGYLSVYPHRDLASARNEVDHLVRQGLSGRSLDLGCGFARHTLALAERGLDAFGMDLSAELLEHARVLETEAQSRASIRGRLTRGDFRHLPFRAAVFDAVCMLFSSFGYLDDGGNARVLREVRRVLRPGGTALLDLMNTPRVRDGLVPRSVTERGGFRLREDRKLTEGGRRVEKDVCLESVEGGPPRMWREDVRLFEPEELRALVKRSGLRIERLAGDFDGRPLTPEAPRQLVWARAVTV